MSRRFALPVIFAGRLGFVDPSRHQRRNDKCVTSHAPLPAAERNRQDGRVQTSPRTMNWQAKTMKRM
jgi:hypothetical protein